MTILSAAIILAFSMIEFFDYRRVNVDTSIQVDKSRGEKLTVNMNVTFPRVPCYRESCLELSLTTAGTSTAVAWCTKPPIVVDNSVAMSCEAFREAFPLALRRNRPLRRNVSCLATL